MTVSRLMATLRLQGERTGRRIIAGAVLLIGGAVVPTAAAGETRAASTFMAGRCDPHQISPNLAPRVRCGTVAVPRDHDDPDGGTFDLAVVVVASATQPAQPDADFTSAVAQGDR